MDFLNPMVRDIRFPIATGASAINISRVAGDTVYVGGEYANLTFGGAPRLGLFAVDKNTAELLPWNPDLLQARPSWTGIEGGAIYYDLLVLGDWVYVTGTVGLLVGFVLRANKDTGVFDTSWGVNLTYGFGLEARGRTLSTDGASIYVGGKFTAVVTPGPEPDAPVVNIARLDLVSGEPMAFDAAIGAVDGVVENLLLIDDTLYATGSFTAVNGGTLRSGAAAFDKTTGVTTSWAPALEAPPLGEALAYSPEEDAIFIAGQFGSVGGDSTKRGLVSVDPSNTGAVNAGFSAAVTGSAITRLAYSEGYLYAIAAFALISGKYPGVAVLAPATGALQDTGLPSGALSSGYPLRNVGVEGRTVYVSGPISSLGLGYDGWSVWTIAPPVLSYYTPQAPRVTFCLRKNGQTLLKWAPVVFSTNNTRIDVDGYKIYRSTNANLESYELIATVTSENASAMRDTMFTENIPGFYGYAVSALFGGLESKQSFVKAVNSDFDSDLFG